MISAFRENLAGGSKTNAKDRIVDDAAAGRVTLIDVRGSDEVAASGKAVGAVQIPLTVLQFQADPRNPDCHPALSVDKPVAVYCASGARSGMAVQMLRQLGYRDARNIGGLNDWTRAGGAISR